MFTGIIKEVGLVKAIKAQEKGKVITIECPKLSQKKKVDESIAVNGTCLTVTAIDNSNLSFYIINESLEKTNLGTLKEGSRVNLEPALELNQGLDGHMVLGHIDTTANVLKLENGSLTIKTPKEYQKYIAYKGSITINGVALTIAKLEENYFTVELIPHTLKHTTLQELQKGHKVNIEVDLIARYLDRLLRDKEKEASYDFLKERNLL